MKKIMFNDKYGLTQAVLEWRKTMTRRIISQKELNRVFSFRETYYSNTLDYLNNKELFEHFYFTEKLGKLPYKVGEIIAIAQSYKDAGYSEKEVFAGWPFSRAGWNNKLFVAAGKMRHHIRITDVKMERLQDISDEDCLKEGIRKLDNPIFGTRYEISNYFPIFNTPREAFASLIDLISGKGTWESNPFVFVYEFELVD